MRRTTALFWIVIQASFLAAMAIPEIIEFLPEEPCAPVELATLDTPQRVFWIAADGSRAVTAEPFGVQVIDLSDPTSPFVAGEFVPTDWFPNCVEVSGDFAYVCDGTQDGPVRILDISEPENITEVGTIDVFGAMAIEVHPPYAYVANYWLHIADVSDPTEPVLISRSAPAHDVSVAFPYAYVAQWSDGLGIVDISNPAEPVQVGHWGEYGAEVEWSHVVAVDSFAYLIYQETIAIFDARDPSDPVFVGMSGFNEVRDIAVSGRTGFVSHFTSDTLDQLDLSDPAFPILIGTASTALPGAQVAVVGDTGLSATAEGILSTFQLCDNPGYDNTTWLPIAAHNDGLENSRWRTDLVVHNLGSATTKLEIVLHSNGNDHRLTNFVDSGDQAVFEDIVGLMGIDGKGALEVRSRERIAVSGRIYDDTGDGTYGQVLLGYRPENTLFQGDTAWLHGLRQFEGQYRTNLSVTNTGPTNARVWVTLYGADGSELAAFELKNIEPGEVVQETEPLIARADRPNVGWAMASVEVVSGRGIIASASVIDSRTNDPSTIPMVH